jgi:hypothetical protein
MLCSRSRNGGIQINTDVQIDPAGNVWRADRVS